MFSHRSIDKNRVYIFDNREKLKKDGSRKNYKGDSLLSPL